MSAKFKEDMFYTLYQNKPFFINTTLSLYLNSKNLITYSTPLLGQVKKY